MKKLILLIVLMAFSVLAQAGGGGSKSPKAPPAPPEPPKPQAPQDPNTALAASREKTRRAQGGGNSSTLLTGDGEGELSNVELSKPKLGGNTLLGG